MKPPITTPGRLRHRLVLEAPADTPDAAGGRDTEWRAVATVAAEIMPLGAAGRDEADHRAVAVGHRIVLRWRPDVDGRMRLRKGSRIFRILAVHDPDEMRRHLVVEAEELVP